MKKIYLLVGLFFALGLIFYPSQTLAEKQKETSAKGIILKYKASSRNCIPTANDQVANFTWGGWKLQSGITDYRVNFANLPSTISRDTSLSVYDLAFSNIQSAGGGILFHFAGESSESTASNDGRNTILWRYLPAPYIALTYIWIDGNSRLVGADTVFNKRYSWSYTEYNGSNDCGGSRSTFDLRNIATHEFGHWAGLGDLYNSSSRDLTMYGYASRGELKKGSLGWGDISGIRAVWP